MRARRLFGTKGSQVRILSPRLRRPRFCTGNRRVAAFVFSGWCAAHHRRTKIGDGRCGGCGGCGRVHAAPAGASTGTSSRDPTAGRAPRVPRGVREARRGRRRAWRSAARARSPSSLRRRPLLASTSERAITRGVLHLHPKDPVGPGAGAGAQCARARVGRRDRGRVTPAWCHRRTLDEVSVGAPRRAGARRSVSDAPASRLPHAARRPAAPIHRPAGVPLPSRATCPSRARSR